LNIEYHYTFMSERNMTCTLFNIGNDTNFSNRSIFLWVRWFNGSVDRSADKWVDRSADKWADRSADKWADRSADRWADRSADRSIDRSDRQQWRWWWLLLGIFF